MHTIGFGWVQNITNQYMLEMTAGPIVLTAYEDIMYSVVHCLSSDSYGAL